MWNETIIYWHSLMIYDIIYNVIYKKKFKKIRPICAQSILIVNNLSDGSVTKSDKTKTKYRQILM